MRLTLALILIVAASAAHARDERLLFSIEDALASAEGQDRFDDTIRFYWGEQAHAPPEHRFGIYSASQKVNALTKTDQQACRHAFLSALATLRDQARKANANAIVNIKSLHDGREFVSDDQFECRAGYLITSVDLEGRVVRLPAAQAATPPRAADTATADSAPIETTPIPAD